MQLSWLGSVSSVPAAVHCSQDSEDGDNDVFQREAEDTTDLEQNFEATNLSSTDEDEDLGYEESPSRTARLVYSNNVNRLHLSVPTS